MADNPSPGLERNPEHRITLERTGERVRVTFDGTLIADTTNAIRLQEASYAPVYYVPRSDAKMDHLVRTDHRTHCPFKGDASYFSLSTGSTAENAVWTYEAPYDEVLDIKDHLAFYPNKATIEVG
jgi:uncharacterized protein (DUF427 family)